MIKYGLPLISDEGYGREEKRKKSTGDQTPGAGEATY